MKKLLLIMWCCVYICALSGCQVAQKDGVEITIEGKGAFPECLAGTWKGDKQDWEVVIDTNGTVSSVVIPLGRVRVRPEKDTVVPMKMNKTSIYESGSWLASYKPDIRELTIEIEIKHFHVEMGDDFLTGDTIEILSGPVGPDSNVWKAQWQSFPTYIVNTSKYTDHELETIDPYQGVVTFTKAKLRD